MYRGWMKPLLESITHDCLTTTWEIGWNKLVNPIYQSRYCIDLVAGSHACSIPMCPSNTILNIQSHKICPFITQSLTILKPMCNPIVVIPKNIEQVVPMTVMSYFILVRWDTGGLWSKKGPDIDGWMGAAIPDIPSHHPSPQGRTTIWDHLAVEHGENGPFLNVLSFADWNCCFPRLC